MKPEDFRVSSNGDGDQFLDCPECGWYPTITHDPKRETEVRSDLGALLAAAQAHIDERHT